MISKPGFLEVKSSNVNAYVFPLFTKSTFKPEKAAYKAGC